MVEVRRAGSTVAQAQAGESAGLVLDRQVDVSRGDWIATPSSLKPSRRFSATLAWLDVEPAVVGRKYWVRHGNRWVQARITRIDNRLDIHTLGATDAHELAVNEIGHVMGLETIAEFVENDAILAELRAIGVDYAQGYALGAPQPLAEVLAGAPARIAVPAAR